MRVQYLFLLLMTGAATAASGQVHVPGKDTVMKGATIEVIQAYKPQVKQAPKPEWVPQLPPPDTTHKAVNYDDVPQQSLYYTYTSMPLHPLALGKEEEKRPFPNYVKLGAGNLNTIYIDAGIGGIYGKDYETAIHLHSLSQKGNIINQQTAQDGIEAGGTLHKKTSDWHAAIMGEQNKFFDYGYNHGLYKYSSDTVKQVYRSLHAIIDVQNKGDSNTAFTWHPAINASGYGAFHNISETSLAFGLPFAYKIENNLQAQLAVSGAITNLKADTVNTSNNYVEVMGGFGFKNSVFTGHALLGFAAGKYNKNYLLPDVLASYTIPDAQCSIFAGVQSTFRQNTYEQLTTENPYLYNMYPVIQSSKGEYFAGVQGGVGDHFTYSARVSYWVYKNLPTFVNNFGDQKQFFVVYDSNLNALSFQLGARYKEANKWSAGITADFYHFSNGSLPYVWGMPATKIKADFVIMPITKLTFTAYLLIEGGIYAQDSYTHIIKLNSFADIGGSGEYQIIPRLSVFLQLNNILNNQYQRWLGYQAYGLNIYGGLRLKF